MYSATYEDGILLYIFSLIGMKNRKCVDIGAGTVAGNNTANLLGSHGLTGLIDGDSGNIKVAMEYHAENKETSNFSPQR